MDYLEKRVRAAAKRFKAELSDAVITHVVNLIYGTNAGYRRGPDQTDYINTLVQNCADLDEDTVLSSDFADLYNFRGSKEETYGSGDAQFTVPKGAQAPTVFWPWKYRGGSKPVDIPVNKSISDIIILLHKKYDKLVFTINRGVETDDLVSDLLNFLEVLPKAEVNDTVQQWWRYDTNKHSIDASVQIGDYLVWQFGNDFVDRSLNGTVKVLRLHVVRPSQARPQDVDNARNDVAKIKAVFDASSVVEKLLS